MKEQIVEGVPVLVPQTDNELREAVASGRPFRAPQALARKFALPEDAYAVGGEDVGVLDSSEDRE